MWARVLVTWHPDANVPRPCRSHKADVQGQEPVLGAPSLIRDDSALFCASLGGVVCRGAGLRSSGSAADRCLPSPRDKTEKNWPPDESDGNGGGDAARVDDGWIIEPRSRFQRSPPSQAPTPPLHSACGSGPASHDAMFGRCSGTPQSAIAYHPLSIECDAANADWILDGYKNGWGGQVDVVEMAGKSQAASALAVQAPRIQDTARHATNASLVALDSPFPRRTVS